MTSNSSKSSKRPRFYLAVGLSAFLVVISGVHIALTSENPLSAKLQDFGQWISGIAGALAFIWLIVSYFQQGEELELQREELAATREQLALQKIEMARLADEASRQAESIQATELHARRDTFMRIAEMMLPELAGICAQFRAQFIGSAGMDSLWRRIGAGDRLSPIQELARIVDQGVEAFQSGYIDRGEGMANVGPKMNRYCEVYEQLIKGAVQADPTEDLRRYFERSGLRTVYSGFCQILNRPRIEISTGTRSGSDTA